MNENKNEKELYNVKLSVQRLNELGDRMRDSQFSFKDNDIRHIDEIISAIYDLDLVRARSKETLEVETIKSSALRHKLLHYPGDITNEVQSAIKAARDLNEETSLSLRQQLDAMSKEIDELNSLSDKLEKENAESTPKLESYKLEYEDVIAKLNSRLSNKASNQIDLNELRDDVRGTTHQTEELEDDMAQLREDLIKERAQTREEKRRLTHLKEEAEKSLAIQKPKNQELKENLEALKYDLEETKDDIRHIKEMIKQSNKEISSLEKSQKDLTEKIKNETKLNEDLRKRGVQIQEDTENMTAAFKTKMMEMAQRLLELDAFTKKEQARYDILEQNRNKVREELEEAQTIAEAESKKARKLNEKLQAAKDEFGLKTTDIGRMQTEMAEMEARMEDMDETHESTMALLAKQIADLKEILGKERTERLEVQRKKEALQREIDEFRAANHRFMQDLNERIERGKYEHEQLVVEKGTLENTIKNNKNESARLEKEIKEATVALAEMKETLTNEIKRMKIEIDDMTKQIELKSSELDVKTPQFKEFEEYFNKQMAKYDVTKKNLVALKSKKAGLQDAITRVNRDIDRQKGSLSSAKEEYSRKQHQSKEQLKHHADQRMQIEEDIYVTGCKLKTLKEENAKLEKGIDDLENEIRQLRQSWENALRIKSKTKQEMDRQRVLLDNAWAHDAEVEQNFADYDQKLVDQLSKLLDDTYDREKRVMHVTNSLEEELKSLNSFLDAVASSRSPSEYKRMKRREPRSVTIENHPEEEDQAVDCGQLLEPKLCQE